MGFSEQIAGRLRALRREQKTPQEVVAKAVSTSVSAVSRLERGMRGLRVDQLIAWSGTLNYRTEIVFWKPTFEDEIWDPEHPDNAMGLDDACARVLSEVASALPHMPEPARNALIYEVRLWKEEAVRVRLRAPDGSDKSPRAR